MHKKLPFMHLAVATLMLNLGHAWAQTDTAADKKHITEDAFLARFEAYKTAKNIPGLISIADLHGYPFPALVLRWQKELQLTTRQKVFIGAINTELTRKTNEMNGFLITNERTLDSLFRYKRISNGSLIYFTNRYGLYQGELRNALLQACLKTEALLTTAQIEKYEALRKDY